MINLMLAIACSSCVSLVMRWSEEKVNSETGMLTVNYLTCSICALLFCADLGFDSASFLCGGTMGVLLVANGTCDAMNKVFEATGDPMYNGQFLLIAFSCALLFSVVRLLVSKERLSFREALFGIMLGIPNYFSSRFLLYALQDIDAIIAYPMYSVLTIIVITLLGIGIWHERITRKTAAGMGGILLSIALMNMQ